MENKINDEILQRALEATYNKGIRFKTEKGLTISIQQKRGISSLRNKSVEVGTWASEKEEIKIYENVSLTELINLITKLKEK